MIRRQLLNSKPQIFKHFYSKVASGYQPNTSYLPTIYALSTHPGRAAIAVVRISGSQCQNVYKILTRKKTPPTPRKIIYSTLYDPLSYSLEKEKDASDDAGVLDHAVLLYFKGPQSYTGEDVLELQLHGGNAIVKAVLKALNKLGNTKSIKEEEAFQERPQNSELDIKLGLRYAEAGEFSKRAFENGALDLTQIEGIRDSIDADTELERISSLPSFSGATKAIYHSWRQQLVESVALLTALIDFSEDSGDVGESANVLFAQAKSKVQSTLDNVREFQDRISRGALVKEGIKLDLLGEPNAGKSHLLNTIVEKEAAIVSDIPGTTRDVLEVGMEIGGYKVLIGDTAGLRRNQEAVENETGIAKSALTIEMEGIRRAKKRFQKSDIILIVIPLDNKNFQNYYTKVVNDTNTTELPKVSQDILREINTLRNKRLVVVLNKEDLLESKAVKDKIIEGYSKALSVEPENVMFTSCVSQTGIDGLLEKISGECKLLVEDSTALNTSSDKPLSPIVASERVETIISHEIVDSLERFLETEGDDDVVIAVEELKHAVDGIAKITGESVGVEEVLGVVFSKFCVGK